VAGVSTVSAIGAGSTGGAATGVREASTELSLSRLEDRVPQPPKAKPRTATTTTTGHTAGLERTVSPLSRGQISVSGCTRLSLFAHGAESTLKTPVTPDLFRLSDTPPDAASVVLQDLSRPRSPTREALGTSPWRSKAGATLCFGATCPAILLFNNGFCEASV